MTVPKHLEDAATRLREASGRIESARAKPPSIESSQEWLAALTQYCAALAEIQEYNNESVHEKLHELAARAGLREFPAAQAKIRRKGPGD